MRCGGLRIFFGCMKMIVFSLYFMEKNAGFS